jgi:peptide deformylase
LAILPIRTYPDPILRERAKPVIEIDDALQTLINNMVETLYAAPGLGLAAPQVGESLRLFVYDLSVHEGKHPLMVVMNPEIVETSGQETDDEGCLSVPHYREKVKRPSRVVLRGLDREGKKIELVGEGLSARLFQHEVDHLNGMLLIDRVSSLKRDIFLRRFRKRTRSSD